ncbi:MAG: hypothetical protein CSA72_02620 [Rhodobacterales bacterium]|nr:MAG: hypothetical protein CSA72_02620 [Rhodobacterales bacterium]
METALSYIRDPDVDILWLTPQENARIDCDVLARLTIELGRDAARESVWQTVDRLNGALSQMADAWARDDGPGIAAALTILEPDFRALGMDMALHVARDVAQVLSGGDDAALAATIARLLRLGDAGAAVFAGT